MYIVDGIAYAGEPKPVNGMAEVRPLDGFKLQARFYNGETRVYDCHDLLSSPAFAPLRDEKEFKKVYLSYGAPTWNDGTIDIDPDTIYVKGTPIK
jgi:hypothetical protein